MINIHRTLSERTMNKLADALELVVNRTPALKGFSPAVWIEDGSTDATVSFFNEANQDKQIHISVEKGNSLTVMVPDCDEAIIVEIDKQVLKETGKIKFTTGAKELKPYSYATAAVKAMYRAAASA